MWYNREGYLGMKGDFMNENISLPEFMRNELVIKTQKELRQRKGYLISKRIFDIVVSLLLLVPLSIVFLVIAIAIKLADGGPVFYRQERVTTNGRKFKIFKFRTMVLNADNHQVTILTKDGKQLPLPESSKEELALEIWRSLLDSNIIQ